VFIILCTIANVILLGGSIQAFFSARKHANSAYIHVQNAGELTKEAEEWADTAGVHSLAAEEQAKNVAVHVQKAEEHANIADQHAQTVGQLSLLVKDATNIRLVDFTKPDHSDVGNNIGKRR
jgi:hypothetical protein